MNNKLSYITYTCGGPLQRSVLAELFLQSLSELVEGRSSLGVRVPAGRHDAVDVWRTFIRRLHAVTLIHTLPHLAHRLQQHQQTTSHPLNMTAHQMFTARNTPFWDTAVCRTRRPPTEALRNSIRLTEWRISTGTETSG